MCLSNPCRCGAGVHVDSPLGATSELTVCDRSIGLTPELHLEVRRHRHYRLVARVVGTYPSEMVEKAPFRVFGSDHSRMGKSYMLQVERRTQWDVGSAPIEFYRMGIAPSCCGAPESQLRRPFAAPPTAPVGAP